MQTFMKMAGAVYTMAGLGSIEDSKLFKEKFDAYAEKDQVRNQSVSSKKPLLNDHEFCLLSSNDVSKIQGFLWAIFNNFVE